MLGLETAALLTGYAAPLIVSPGPGNTLLTSAGARLGVSGAARFWIGFEIGNLLLCLLYGLGFGTLLHGAPSVYLALKWAGTAYLLYLAWGFARAALARDAMAEATAIPFTLTRGIASVLINPKIHSMIAVMMAQFLDPQAPLVGQTVLIGLLFTAISIPCHFLWLFAGQAILRRFTSRRARIVQNGAFALCMILVAIGLQ